MKVISSNKKAFHEYHVLDTVEAGICLKGTEIKSIRAARVNFKDSYARVENDEMFLFGMHISPYEQGNRYNVDPERIRKLLLHRAEIRKLVGKTAERGMTLVPLKIYLKNNRAKVELGLVKGKKLHDKREAIANRDRDRLAKAEMKERMR